jgi:hypothetical protein
MVFSDKRVKIWKTDNVVNKDTGEEISSQDDVVEFEKGSNVSTQDASIKKICLNAWAD